MLADMLDVEIADLLDDILAVEIAVWLRATEGQNPVLIQRASADRN